jgi:DNA-binding MarR family transcriptional regulator
MAGDTELGGPQSHRDDVVKTTPAADPIEVVADTLERLAMWVRRNAPSQLSTSTVTTLDTLASKGPLRISQLAEHEAISQPGMTTLVNRLEAAGHAERIGDPTDGRAALVRITEAGRAVLAQRHLTRAAALQTQLERLDAGDVSALRAALPAIERLTGAGESTPTPRPKPKPEQQQSQQAGPRR